MEVIVFLAATILFVVWSAPTVTSTIAESLRIKPANLAYGAALVSFCLMWASIGLTMSFVVLALGLWLRSKG